MENVVMLEPGKDGGTAQRVCDFFAKEGAGLLAMLELVGDFDAADAIRELADRDAPLRMDADQVRELLENVLDALRNLPSRVVDDVARAGFGPRDFHAALRWYGGRVEQHVNELTS